MTVFHVSVGVWGTISTILFESSQFYGRSQQCSCLDGLHTFSYFQVPQSVYTSFKDCTRSTDYNWYHRHFHVPSFCKFSGKVKVLISLFLFFQFYSVVSRDSEVHNSANSFFLFIVTKSDRLAKMRWSVCISKYQMSPCVSFSRIDSGLCIYHFFVWSISCTIPSESPYPPSRVWFYILSVLKYCVTDRFISITA